MLERNVGNYMLFKVLSFLFLRFARHLVRYLGTRTAGQPKYLALVRALRDGLAICIPGSGPTLPI